MTTLSDSAWDKVQQVLVPIKIIASKKQYNSVGYTTYSGISFYTYSPVAGPIVDSLWMVIYAHAYEHFK
jgi:hypothetical protein